MVLNILEESCKAVFAATFARRPFLEALDHDEVKEEKRRKKGGNVVSKMHFKILDLASSYLSFCWTPRW